MKQTDQHQLSPNNRLNSPSGKKLIGNYELKKTLGKGTFGKVKLAVHRLTRQQVAIKILDKDKITETSDIERVSREIHILKRLRHRHIIQLYEIVESARHLCLVMEYCEGGELFDYIVKKRRLDEVEACRLLQQLISAVEYMHQQGAVHRDLKPQNLLLDESFNIKLADFGLSNTYLPGGKMKTPCGSPSYAAPEMIQNRQYVPLAVDLWSSGIILYGMLTGYLPFEEKNNAIMYRKILNLDYSIPKFVSTSAKQLLEGMINTSEFRYCIDQIRKSSFFGLVAPAQCCGVRIGAERIPVDPQLAFIIEKQFGFSQQSIYLGVENNKHNCVTTCYYLLQNLARRQGLTSPYDINSVLFPKTLAGYRQKMLSAQANRQSKLSAQKTSNVEHAANNSPTIDALFAASHDYHERPSSRNLNRGLQPYRNRSVELKRQVQDPPTNPKQVNAVVRLRRFSQIFNTEQKIKSPESRRPRSRLSPRKPFLDQLKALIRPTNK